MLPWLRTGPSGVQDAGFLWTQMKHIGLKYKEIAPILKVAFQNWRDDRAPRMGAALAYYIALSLAPTLLILLAVISWVFGIQTAHGRVASQIQNLVGYEGTTAIRSMIDGIPKATRGSAATVFGVVTVFFASSAVVGELRDAMNSIWRVPREPAVSTARSIFDNVKSRLVSFILVLTAGILLVVSLIMNAWIFAAGSYLNSGVPLPKALLQTTDWVVSFVVITVLFAFIFKVLPRVPVHWGDVAIGSIGTALLFVAGKLVLGLYLGKAGFANTYGAAGSLVVVLVWVYYSAQVLYLGAEFTRAYACLLGSMPAPENDSPACVSPA